MTFEIIDESEKKRFVIKMYGRYSVEDNAMMMKQLVAHPHWEKGLDVLVDIRQVIFSDEDLAEVSKIVDIVTVIEKDYGAGRCAIVAPLDGHHIVAMYNYVVNANLNELETRLFHATDYKNAVRWLDTEA